MLHSEVVIVNVDVVHYENLGTHVTGFFEDHLWTYLVFSGFLVVGGFVLYELSHGFPIFSDFLFEILTASGRTCELDIGIVNILVILSIIDYT